VFVALEPQRVGGAAERLAAIELRWGVLAEEAAHRPILTASGGALC
jgi:hypothetical protein